MAHIKLRTCRSAVIHVVSKLSHHEPNDSAEPIYLFLAERVAVDRQRCEKRLNRINKKTVPE